MQENVYVFMSGGIASLLTYYITKKKHKNIIPVYINYFQRNYLEIHSLKRLLALLDENNLKEIKMNISNMNLYYAIIEGINRITKECHASKIYLGFTCKDIKDINFLRFFSIKDYDICLPLIDKDYHEIVEEIKANNLPIKDTFSCLIPFNDGQECGHCSGCLQRKNLGLSFNPTENAQPIQEKYKISSIFWSIQGEGHFTGTSTVFIRFAGCNQHCDFCDEIDKYNTYNYLSLEEILTEIQKYSANHICLTGGEPSLQVDNKFIEFFHKYDYFIQIETNGILPVPEKIDWITVSPKTKRYLIGDELKVLYDLITPDMDLEKGYKYKYVQPISNKNIPQCIEFIKINPEWKLSLQTHKFIGIE